MGLKLIRSANDELNRVQQNMQTALDALALTPQTSAAVRKDYTASTTDVMIFVDASGGPVRITLPVVGNVTVAVVKTDASTNAVTVQAGDASKISGATSLVAGKANVYAYNPVSKGWFQI